MRLYCATKNPGKLREFVTILGGVEPLPNLQDIAPPEETGETFEANAADKAIYYSRFCDDPVFVDDSGLAVDALGGAPGVCSARFAGPQATDVENNQLLLEKMRGVENRACRFVCVVALARCGSLISTFRGEVEGELLYETRGPNGFGYDPLFYYRPFGCSFGETPAARKQEVSHRGKALRALGGYLSETGNR